MKYYFLTTIFNLYKVKSHFQIRLQQIFFSHHWKNSILWQGKYILKSINSQKLVTLI